MTVTLVKTFSNGRCGAWTSSYLLYSGKTSSGQIGTPIQPHNHSSTVGPAYKICWDKGGAEIMGWPNNEYSILRPILWDEAHPWQYLEGQDPEAGQLRNLV